MASADEFNAMMRERAKQALGTAKPKADPVNHPAHYKFAGFEVIEILEAALPASWFQGYCLGNVFKYLFRFPKKNGLEDVKKAAWYLQRLIQKMEETDGKESTDAEARP